MHIIKSMIDSQMALLQQLELVLDQEARALECANDDSISAISEEKLDLYRLIQDGDKHLRRHLGLPATAVDGSEVELEQRLQSLQAEPNLFDCWQKLLLQLQRCNDKKDLNNRLIQDSSQTRRLNVG